MMLRELTQPEMDEINNTYYGGRYVVPPFMGVAQ